MEYKPPAKIRRTSSLDTNTLVFVDQELSSYHRPQCKCTKIGRYLKKNCNTDCRSKLPQSCPLAHKWCHMSKLPPNRSEIYHQLSLVNIDSEKYRKYIEQIEIDLTRTFPDIEYFTTGQGVDSMRRVLKAFVKYHYQLGYVQGMNYIVCALLWHACEVDAFWLLVVIMDEYKLRENYLFRFPGLTKHCELTELLLSLYMPKLYSHFSNHCIMVQMFATDWYLTIFTSLVPIESSSWVFNSFFKDGWIFIYKFLMTIMERLEDQLLKKNDRIDMLSLIKPIELVNNDSKKFLVSLQKRRETLTWEKLIESSNKKTIDKRHIENFLQNYQMEIFVE
ncbi:hypothetical protein SteCoe_6438 [Stentor coeruleus]|uniref:Rab-GAP TBC domain-containing protein n=1 Tax=Stentor coeruleus TaxID=5963 RepID=A0A1R2CPZ6_9CILI|nr:hypothetical protein SteCoe_6438 [Stentor coeruleus]